MKLSLNFDLYKGKTALKQWWGEVKNHFTQVQMAHNDLEDTVVAERAKLSTEITQRANADIALSNRINGMIKNEAGALAEADAEILEKIIAETAARKEADNALGEEIGGEANARETADTELTARIELVEYKAHMHANKSVLDGIDAERVSIWDSIKTQVTAAQLDALRAYFDELCFGFSDEIKRIYDAMGVTLYDGGMFGMMQEDTPLDGGSFADTELNLFDCGGFGKYGITAEVGAVVDGGQY